MAVLVASAACGGGGSPASPPVDSTPPAVASLRPADGEAGVAPTAVVQATLGEPIDCTAVGATGLSLTGPGGTAVAGSVACASPLVTFTPAAPLAWSASYEARLSGSIRDLAGNRLGADRVWSFTTRANPDVTPPAVVSTSPVDGATGVLPGATIRATFSEPVAVDGAPNAIVVLDGSGNPVPGTLSVSGPTVTFTPSALLALGVRHEITVGSGVRDLAGNPFPPSGQLTFHFVTGTLDTGFGTGGIATRHLSSGDDWANAVLVQPSGSIVAGAVIGNGTGAALVGFLPDGATDSAFGGFGAGMITTGVFPQAMVSLPGGSFYVAGGMYYGSLDFAVARYTAAGVLDPSFGSGGMASVSTAPGDDLARAIGLQSAGAIVLAGTTPTGSAVVRFRADGTLDGSFGVVRTPMTVAGMAIAPDDRILLAGTLGAALAVARLQADGTLDGSFGTGGYATYQGGLTSYGRAIVVLPDGSAVVGGSYASGGQVNMVLVGFTSSGGLDAAFGYGGVANLPFSNASSEVTAMVATGDGRIVVAGTLTTSLRSYGLARRFLRVGSHDPTFGGWVQIDTGSPFDATLAVAVQPDGKTVVAGRGGTGAAGTSIAVARVLP